MTLPFILLIGGIIVEIAIAGSFVAYFLSTSGYGERLSIRATAASNSGIRDAIVRIAQNKEFTEQPCSDPYVYSFPVGEDSVTVSVCRASESSKYVYTIESIGYAESRQKKLVARIPVDKITGYAQIESVLEEAIE